MADFESLLGSEASEGGMSTEAVERLREQMRKASGAIKAIQKEERKQKKKEDKLVSLLVKMIKNKKNRGILTLIITLLKEDIPASFILAIMILGDEEIKKEAGDDLKLTNYDDPEKKFLEGKDIDLTKEERKILKRKAEEMRQLDNEEVLSPQMKKDLNEWGEALLAAGFSSVHKTLGTVLDAQNNIKAPVVQLSVFSLREYLESHGSDYEYEEMVEFCGAVLKSVMIKLKKSLKKQAKPEIE